MFYLPVNLFPGVEIRKTCAEASLGLADLILTPSLQSGVAGIARMTHIHPTEPTGTRDSLVNQVSATLGGSQYCTGPLAARGSKAWREDDTFAPPQSQYYQAESLSPNQQSLRSSQNNTH